MSTSEELAQGQILEKQGDLRGAENVFRRIVAGDSNSVEACYRLGMVCLKQGKFVDGAIFLKRTVELNPEFAEGWCNLGMALASSGELHSAEGMFRQAVFLNPNRPDFLRNLSSVLRELGRADEAHEILLSSLQLDPDNTKARYTLAVTFRNQGRSQEAIVHLRYAVRSSPDHVPSWILLSELLFESGNVDEAAHGFRTVTQIAPNSINGHNGLGIVLSSKKDFNGAIESFRKALLINPNSPITLSNLGNAQKWVGNFEDALLSFNASLTLDAANADTLVNLGSAYDLSGRYAEAAECYRNAIAHDPNHATAHHNLALFFLRTKAWEQGWSEFEWRWKCKEFTPRRLHQPLWNGCPLIGKRILIHSEQGIGDTIQFIRYAELVKGLGAYVIFECEPFLAPILSSCKSIDAIVARGTPLPNFDTYAPVMSLPRIMRSTPASVPKTVPYLDADPHRIETWKQKLPLGDGMNIGIIWQGNRKYLLNHQRSMPLESLLPLARLQGVRLVSLQKGCAHELAVSPFSVLDFGDLLDANGVAFMDTAAIMKCLDLVISVDSAPAHLAGALGVPIWVALAHQTDWRWMDEDNETVWYPSMRLFRQSAPGDWVGVIQRMVHQVRQIQAS